MDNSANSDSDPESLFHSELFIDKSYTSRKVSFGGHELTINALHNSSSTDHDLTGQIIWPAAKLLSYYMVEHAERHKNERILEVGAGVGLSGLIAAKLNNEPGRVVLTDNNDYVLELLQNNITENFTNSDAGIPKCAMLSWGSGLDEFYREHGDFDLIIGADVVFWPNAVPLLMETISFFMEKNPKCSLVLSYISRSSYSTDLLFKHATEQGLCWTTVNLSENESYTDLIENEKHCGRSCNILIFTRKVQ